MLRTIRLSIVQIFENPQFPGDIQQVVTQKHKFGGERAWELGRYHQIPAARPGFVGPKSLPTSTFEQIPLYRASVTASHHKAKPGQAGGRI